MQSIKNIVCGCGFKQEEKMDTEGKILMMKYEFGKLLGKGNFAKVYHAKDLRTNESVAIKVMDKVKMKEIGLLPLQTKREISTMRKVKHPNVLRLYEVIATKTKIYFIIEYAKGGELFHKIAKGRITENQARKYFQQLITALDFCHSKGVYHRDLKPENLLLDENGVLKIADFGLSTYVESNPRDSLLKTICGTPAYVSPEIIMQKGYRGAKNDVWSCGVILYVLLAGRLPFYDQNLMNLYTKIGRGEYKCPSWFPDEVRKLLSRILDPNPNTRISTARIMENPWFRKGLIPKSVQVKEEIADVSVADCGKESAADVDEIQLSVQPKYLNAFHILSLSPGLNLSVLFTCTTDEKDDIKFTSMCSASSIVSKIENLADILLMKIVKEDGWILKMERPRELRRGPLVMTAEIFEFAPSFYLVEIKKSCGDLGQYQKLLSAIIRPFLNDIVWIWQDEQQQQHNISKAVSGPDEIH